MEEYLFICDKGTIEKLTEKVFNVILNEDFLYEDKVKEKEKEGLRIIFMDRKTNPLPIEEFDKYTMIYHIKSQDLMDYFIHDKTDENIINLLDKKSLKYVYIKELKDNNICEFCNNIFKDLLIKRTLYMIDNNLNIIEKQISLFDIKYKELFIKTKNVMQYLNNSITYYSEMIDKHDICEGTLDNDVFDSYISEDIDHPKLYESRELATQVLEEIVKLKLKFIEKEEKKLLAKKDFLLKLKVIKK